MFHLFHLLTHKTSWSKHAVKHIIGEILNHKFFPCNYKMEWKHIQAHSSFKGTQNQHKSIIKKYFLPKQSYCVTLEDLKYST